MPELSLDIAARLIRLKTSKFLDETAARALIDSTQEMAREARARWGFVRCVVDARESPVQTLAIAETLHSRLRDMITGSSDYIAIVTSTLKKMQTDRLLLSPRARVFTTVEEAEAWLQNLD